MGSLSSRPKNAVKNTTTTIAANNTAIAPTITTTATTTEPDSLEIAKTRVENILRRSRGFLGTVITGFRGTLSDNTRTPTRKSLLGE